MEILKSDFNTILELLFRAKRQIVLSVPNISVIVADALIELKSRNIKIDVFMEINEHSYRTGYGEIEALKKLADANVPLHDKKEVNLYFFIIDDDGFFHFPKSHFTEEEGIAYDLFPMESNQIVTAKFLFKVLDEDDEIDEDIIESLDPHVIQTILNNTTEPKKEIINNLVTKISKDPPQKPEYNRILSVYTGKFQIVEMKLKGANISVKKVNLPPSALPFKDAKLKKAVDATLRLFTNLSNNEFMKPLFALNDEVDKIREKYLVRLKERDKSLIRREEKAEFEGKLLLIRNKVKEVKDTLLNNLQDEIGKSRDSIAKNLTEFLRVNQTDNLIGLEGDTLEKEIAYIASSIISKIHFPSAKKLLEEICLTCAYYDITWEDLNNKKVLAEMVEKRLISPEECAFISEKAIGIEEEMVGQTLLGLEN